EDDMGVVTYMATTPTPRRLNDGTGIPFVGVGISVSTNRVGEGEMFEITCTSDGILSIGIEFLITLNNEGFNVADFSGDTSLSIAIGENNVGTQISIVDDNLDEGDEVIKIQFDSLPEGFLPLNNNIEVRVVDNDFTIAAFGTPINPTYDIVEQSVPNSYYNSLNGKADDDLREALQELLSDSSSVRTQTYADVIDILNEADQNPLNSNEVWLVYSEEGRPKLDFQTSSDNTGKWNREHTYPRSRGDFGGREGDDIADGIDIFWETNADSLRHANSDAHALRAADAVENSNRGNQHYGEYTGPAGNQGSFLGDVARSVLYMDVRYNDLAIVNGFPAEDGQLGDLATLLDWHRNDPPDDYEMNRNNVVYQWQNNRNPFIDEPDLVEHLWGDKIGTAWVGILSNSNETVLSVEVFPNPATNKIMIKGIQGEVILAIYSMDGKLIRSLATQTNDWIPLNIPKGIYNLNVQSEGKQASIQLITNY
ncbi:MAG: endonuclease, partial [Bacteroidota bacterium]